MPDTPAFWKKGLLSALAVLVALGVLEAGLRTLDYARGVSYIPGLGYTDNPSVILYQWHPFLGKVLKPGARWQGQDYYGQQTSMSINSLGYRGKEVSRQKPPGTFRIVALGESTTFGAGSTSDDTTYPAQLERILNQRLNTTARTFEVANAFEVINAGVAGYTTAESIISLSLRLLDLKPDMVVIYHTWNDLGHNKPQGFQSDYSHNARPKGSPSLLEHSRLYVKVKGRLALGRAPAAATGERSDAPSQEGVAAFQRNLKTLVAIARASGARVVLASFATSITPDNLERYPEKLLGVSLYQPYLTPQGVMAGIQQYNEAIRQVAQEEKVPLAPAAETIAPDFDSFVDHVHLTDRGADLLAQVIADTIADSYFPGSGLGRP